ncbi:DUF4956 domain-containing protein [bacterium]|nr:DUF4956 domain-containing protein [bacterium]MCP5462751.1 DUF4956 domain-containing protein [bacterium]
MRAVQALQKYLSAQLAQLSIGGFCFNLLLAACLAYWLGRVYIVYGSSLSNRKMLAKSFIMLAMTTMLIITLIQSSLPLSLGLLGALSIIRFRAAIKEPEELTYLFLAITIGLGFGAGQRILTIVALVMIIIVIKLRHKFSGRKTDSVQNLYLTITTHNPNDISLETVTAILKDQCQLFRMKRMDKLPTLMEVSFLVEFKSEKSLYSVESSLRKLDESIKINFLDYKGALGAL